MKHSYNRYTFLLLLLLIVAGFSGCDKYLAEPPSKTSSLVVTTTAQLDAC